MSADNYYVITQEPSTGKWLALMGFMSDERPVRLPTPESAGGALFDSERQAWAWAETEYSEYGIFSAHTAPFGVEASDVTARLTHLVHLARGSEAIPSQVILQALAREVAEAYRLGRGRRDDGAPTPFDNLF